MLDWSAPSASYILSPVSGYVMEVAFQAAPPQKGVNESPETECIFYNWELLQAQRWTERDPQVSTAFQS